jgi:hypothetical protein
MALASVLEQVLASELAVALAGAARGMDLARAEEPVEVVKVPATGLVRDSGSQRRPMG